MGGTAAITGNTTVGGTLGVTGGTTLSSTANIGSTLTMSGNNFANNIVMANGGTGGTTFNIFSTSDSFAQPSANWMLHHASAGNGIILADQNGRVRMPYQPMFALKNTGNSTHYKQASVQINQGSHWDNVSGRFTAPIAGNYFFFGGLQSSGSGNPFYWGLYKNGTLQTSFYMNHNYTYGHGSVAQIISLAASDYVEFKMAGSQSANTGGQNHFSGFLIG